MADTLADMLVKAEHIGSAKSSIPPQSLAPRPIDENACRDVASGKQYRAGLRGRTARTQQQVALRTAISTASGACLHEAADISKTVALADGLLLASTAWPAAPPHRHAEEADRYEVLAAQRTTQFHILLAVHASLWSRRGLAARLRPCVRCEEAKEAECYVRKQDVRVSDVGFRQACCAGKVWAGAPVNPSSQSAAVLSPLPLAVASDDEVQKEESSAVLSGATGVASEEELIRIEQQACNIEFVGGRTLDLKEPTWTLDAWYPYSAAPGAPPPSLDRPGGCFCASNPSMAVAIGGGGRIVSCDSALGATGGCDGLPSAAAHPITQHPAVGKTPLCGADISNPCPAAPRHTSFEGRPTHGDSQTVTLSQLGLRFSSHLNPRQPLGAPEFPNWRTPRPKSHDAGDVVPSQD
ncbi:hypothetical protein PCL_01110 [Purpureocillium lilacinum]|uniref:Uncharacterized protein n=1 Tax=Purpureocillium lilacinum TaxID=33203 RepID=A0A2U3E4M0_PURLI|nr:hypothetical protein PCL_01110 [Purpureocillium lilacinum]